MHVRSGLGSILAGYLSKLNLCSLVGYIVGALAGLLLTIQGLKHGGLSLNSKEVFYITIVLTVFTFFVMLIILGAFVRMRVSSFAVGVFLNCFFTCFLIVLLVNGSEIYIIAWLIGMIVGIIVGSSLCWLNVLTTVKDRNISWGCYHDSCCKPN